MIARSATNTAAKIERIALIKERYRKLILETRGALEADVLDPFDADADDSAVDVGTVEDDYVFDQN